MVSHSVSSSDNEEADVLDLEHDKQWEDVEPDVEKVEVVSLFDDVSFDSVASMLQYCKDTHDFDLAKVQQDLKLGLMETIKLVNFIRSERRQGKCSLDISTKSAFQDDHYLQPVIEDDPLLYSLEDIITEQAFYSGDLVDGPTSFAMSEGDALKPEEIAAKFREHEHQLATTKEALQASAKQLELTERALQQVSARADLMMQQLDSSSEIGSTRQPDKSLKYHEHDDCYAAIHHQMLDDKVRTGSYQKFIMANKHLFDGKIVLDVGCGTSILSMFCAQAGAKQVFAVEQSTVYQKAQKIVFDNGFQDVIKVLHGRVQDISLPVPKVDIIISEWMGYCLLFEGMLDSVIWARDRYLCPNGLMIPAYTSLRIAPVSKQVDNNGCGFRWNDVYGFDMRAMTEDTIRHVDTTDVPAHRICGTPSLFKTLSMYTSTVPDLNFKDAQFRCTFDKVVPNGLDGLVIWFDTYFSTTPSFGGSPTDLSPTAFSEASQGNVAFTTGPFAEPTHWMQGVLLFDPKVAPPPEEVKAGQAITGKVAYSKGARPSDIEIQVEWRMEGEEIKGKQIWVLE